LFSLFFNVAYNNYNCHNNNSIILYKSSLINTAVLNYFRSTKIYYLLKQASCNICIDFNLYILYCYYQNKMVTGKYTYKIKQIWQKLIILQILYVQTCYCPLITTWITKSSQLSLIRYTYYCGYKLHVISKTVSLKSFRSNSDYLKQAS
jgi:hypothetical protein